ncbi:MAG: hypothetical protein AAGD32_12780 [Planctomycetota bacterium]
MTSRIVLFAALLILPIGLLGYVAYDATRTGGIRQTDTGFKVSLKEMSTFPFDQQAGTVDDVPQRFRELDGQTVILIGQMWAPDQIRGPVPDFELVYSIVDCCFVGEPQIQHFVQADVPDDMEVRLYGQGDFIEVIGTLRVEVEHDESGRIIGVYHLDVHGVQKVS